MSVEQINVARVLAYLLALEAGTGGADLAAYFANDAVQIELPSRLNPRGARNDLAALLARAERGRLLLKTQHFDVRSVVAQQSRVAVEASWSGVLAVPFDGLAAGDTMNAHFAMFFEMADSCIKTQRNYDSFEPQAGQGRIQPASDRSGQCTEERYA